MKKKITDNEIVSKYMQDFEHLLKTEIEELRKIIMEANNKISERIKWNAPSYYYIDDFLTFNPRMTDKVHLIFHHKYISEVKSEILEGEYKDRRMVYFENMQDVLNKKQEFQKVIVQILNFIDNKKSG